MKTTLTDYKTGKQITILHSDPFLPAWGSDGIQYFFFTNNLYDYFGRPRTDCTVLDLKHGGIIPIRTVDGKESIKFFIDKESFDEANSIEEYVKFLKEKHLMLWK